MNPLACHGISFRYQPRGRWVINDFTHSFKPGLTLIKGASGCGKSTLLRLLAGYLKPAAGRIETPSGCPAASQGFQREELGFVFQQLNLLPLATLERNLELAGSLAGLDGAELRGRTTEWLGLLGLSHLARERPCALSAGQQQRAAIARAMIKHPGVLLLDEPTSGLDDLNTRIIQRALVDYVTGPRVCVVCSHDHRLDEMTHEILDFNRFLPLEGYLVALA